MTERDVMFEERIRQSLQAVAEGAVVAERPIDDSPDLIDLPAGPGGGPPRARLAVAACVAVFAIVAAVVVARRGDSLDTITTPTPITAPALPRISLGYLPPGMAATPQEDLPDAAKPPGWVSTWTKPNPNGGEQGVDWLQVLVATPDQADQLPNLVSPVENGNYPLSTAVARDVYQSIAGDKGFPAEVPIHGHPATPFIGQAGRVGLAWTLGDGTRVAVVETSNSSLDALTGLANGLNVSFPSGPMADPSVTLEPSTIPDGFTHLGDGRGDLFVQSSGTRQIVTTKGTAPYVVAPQFEVRTLSQPFRVQDLGWAIAGPGATDLLGQDGLRFTASHPPDGTGPSVPGRNTVYGGRADISIRLEGFESVEELLKVAAGIRIVSSIGIDAPTQPGSLGTTSPGLTTRSSLPGSESSPDSAPGTTASWGYPAPLPGTELFRHKSIDGHALLVGRLVTVPDDCTPADNEGDPLCRNGRPGTSFTLDSIIDSDYVGGGGGGVPSVWDPSIPITSGGAGGGGRPGHERVYVVYATGPATTLVQVDIRQPDGSVATDSMAPAHGIAAFSAVGYGDFVGRARAYDVTGTLLGTALQAGATFGSPPPPSRS